MRFALCSLVWDLGEAVLSVTSCVSGGGAFERLGLLSPVSYNLGFLSVLLPK